MPTPGGTSTTTATTALRRLAACPQCRAQYDVTGMRAGERFHCACGAVATVAETPAHEAAVVRCSSCGAPRVAENESGERSPSNACGFCGSDFTLHERDLHTICPGCATRISDSARYCHSCGLTIAPVARVVSAEDGATAERPTCPACGSDKKRLTTRELGGADLTVLECGACAGLWLGSEAFRAVEKRARDRQTGVGQSLPASATERVETPGEGGRRLYRPCPACGQLMHRKNYGRRSGVVIDVCAKDGMWFDQGELDRILRWIGDGGLARAERLEHEKRRDEDRARAAGAAPAPGPLFESTVSSTGSGGRLGDFVYHLFDFLTDWYSAGG